MLTFLKSIQVIDSHTAGEPTRILLGNVPPVPGATMLEKYRQAPLLLDDTRKFLMLEPRGHNDMFGAFLMPPTRPDCQYGVLFCHSDGFLKMCGHGSIGIARTLVSLGIIPATPPVTTVRLDTPGGPVELRVATPGGENPPGEVVLKNLPAFACQTDLVTHLPGLDRPIHYDIAFGGNFFALLDVSQLDLKIHTGNTGKLLHAGMLLREIINREAPVAHPLFSEINGVDLVEFYEPHLEKSAPVPNTVVFGNHQLDRSPCGTGTCAKMALLAHKGLLRPGERYISQSITGTRFEGWVEPGPRLGDYPGWIPYIQGKAYITGINQWVGEKDDPFMNGFLLSRE